jgi:nucleotide-binding universal stress UspA family protein
VITRILLGIDRTLASHAAQTFAIEIARTHGAALTGLAILDAYWLAPEALWVGQEEARSLLASLQQAAQAAGVACEAHARAAEPTDALLAEAIGADLVVVNRDATFWLVEHCEVSDAVRSLLPRIPRPVLLAPRRDAPGGDRVLVAFDGSPPASRSLHMFALLGLARGKDVHVLGVTAERAGATPLADAAAALLRAHGAKSAQTHAVSSTADPVEVITNHARAIDAGIVVMGAYGHKGLRDMVFGSCTRRMLESCHAALFVHH